MSNAQGAITQLNVRIPKELHDRLRRMADHEGITLGALTTRALADYLAAEQDSLRAALTAEYERARQEIAEFERAHQELLELSTGDRRDEQLRRM